MARRSNSRPIVRSRPFWIRLARWFFIPPGLFFTMIVITSGLAWWKWDSITSWTRSIVSSITNAFGWGLVFVALAVGALIFLAMRHRLNALWYGMRYYLGAICYAFAAWGVLAFLGIGGSIGQGIIGSTDLLGGLRVLGIAVLGTVLILPEPSWRLTRRLAYGTIYRMQRRHPGAAATGTLASVTTAVNTAAAEGPAEDAADSAALTPPAHGQVTPRQPAKDPAVPPRPATARTVEEHPNRQELKQIAQQVWKKYGESPSLQVVDGWKLPPVDILEKSPDIVFNQADNTRRARLIEEALESYGVEAKVVQINTGPTVTQFGIEPGWDRRVKEFKEKDREGNTRVRQEEVSKTRVKVDRISSLSNDLALALSASTVRIEAPIPGQPLVGIEVPNTTSTSVTLRGVIETSAFQKMLGKSRLNLALGKGAGGEAVTADLTRMPHLLIAGATGSGKTVCLNTIICSLLLTNTPYDLRFVLIDPKRVELTGYNTIPHLAAPVVVEAEKAVEALRWLQQEMDRRYQRLQASGARSIDIYNKSRQGEQRMPYLVLVVDELADLMMQSGDEVERMLCRLAQLARAVGIHLVVATQRPSVDVITGLIKANFPTRISFAVTSLVDSRTILDGAGAEKLLGKGDMLYLPTEAAKPKRLQGCYVSDAEIERLVYFWNNQRRDAPSLKVESIAPAQAAIRPAAARSAVAGTAASARPATGLRPPTPVAARPVLSIRDDDQSLKPLPAEDPLMEEARMVAAEHPHYSASYLQRKLRIGFNRAANIAERLQQEGFGPENPGYGGMNERAEEQGSPDEQVEAGKVDEEEGKDS
jgi:DNA segregation ATPase FtsK/SpoIIIE, S-DNA-T family